MINKIKHKLSLVIIFGLLYLDIEVIFRALMSRAPALKGWTSLHMIYVGGLSIYLIGLLNERYKLSIRLQAILGAIIITSIELISGLIFNIKLGLELWNYSDISYNMLGQVCLPFSLIWLILVPLAIYSDDALRYMIYNEEKPQTLCSYYKRLFKGK